MRRIARSVTCRCRVAHACSSRVDIVLWREWTLAQRQTSAAKNMRRHMGNKKQKPQLRKQLTAPGPMNRGTVSGSSLL